MKQLAIILIATVCVAGLFVAEDAKAEGSERSVFQQFYNSISTFTTDEGGEKKPLTDVFQRSSDGITRNSPAVKKRSLRGNKEEVERRRRGN